MTYARMHRPSGGSRLGRSLENILIRNHRTNKKEIEMARAGKPNILVLWGDDIGWWNISHNSRGQMGYWTRNIDLCVANH
jgi:hypothetical protein